MPRMRCKTTNVLIILFLFLLVASLVKKDELSNILLSDSTKSLRLTHCLPGEGLDSLPICSKVSLEQKSFLKAEAAHYEKNKKFKAKIREAKGEAPVASPHASVIKF